MVKEAYYRKVKSLLGKHDNAYIIFSWEKLLSQTDFTERVNKISHVYWEQKAADEKLAAKLEELRKNPEYLEKVKETETESPGNLDALMSVLKKYSGIDMGWCDLVAFGLRYLGLL